MHQNNAFLMLGLTDPWVVDVLAADESLLLVRF